MITAIESSNILHHPAARDIVLIRPISAKLTFRTDRPFHKIFVLFHSAMNLWTSGLPYNTWLSQQRILAIPQYSHDAVALSAEVGNTALQLSAYSKFALKP